MVPKSNSVISAGISSLGLPRCPSAVFGTIIRVVVNALNCVMFRGAISHIDRESGKIVPSAADTNASPAIPMKQLVGRTPATIQHCPPNTILRAVRRSMDNHAPPKATTAFRVPVLQVIATNGLCLAAFATNLPKSLPTLSSPGFSDYSESPKAFTDSYRDLAHACILVKFAGVSREHRWIEEQVKEAQCNTSRAI